MSRFCIGISGWRYKPWRDNFYPKGLVQKKELYFASRSVNSIEINGSFYALQTPERYRGWYAEVPKDFVFSVKAPRYITHIRRLDDIEEPLANFFASGIFELKEKLGAILWQFPPSFKFNPEQFRAFLQLLPHSTQAAETFTQTHHSQFRLPEQFPHHFSLRHAVEIRNISFANESFIALLREFNIAFVIADTAGRWPYAEDITSDFVYMRLHGDTELYNSGYSPEAIEHWYKRINAWRKGTQPRDAKLFGKRANLGESLDVFCYFDNTDKLWAPKDARELSRLLKIDKTLKSPEEILQEVKAKND